MDFREILQSMNTLAEGETKETEKGRVHKGSYGRHFDTDEEGDEKKKEKKPEVKKGRGRPKKDAGEDGEKKTYDTKSLHGVFGGGQKPKKEIGKTSKKHSLKEYIEEIAETKTQLDEAEQITIAPAQQNTQVIKKGNDVLGSVSNPQLAAQIKAALGKGEMQLAGDELMDESGLQAYLGNKKYGKDGMDALRKAGREGASKEKMASIRAKYDKMDEAQLDEKAVSKKQQRFMGMVHAAQKGEKPASKEVAKVAKTMKKSDAKDFAKTKHKGLPEKVKQKADESIMQDESTVLNEGAFMNLAEYLNEVLGSDKYRDNFQDAVLNKDTQKASRIIKSIMSMDDNFRRRPHTLKTQLEDHCLEENGFTNYEESLMDDKVLPEVSSKDIARTSIHPVTGEPTSKFEPSRVQGTRPIEKPMDWKTDPIQATTDRAINFISGLRKPKAKGPFESKDMKDMQIESWEKELNNLLNEGITVSTSTGQQGAPDSVSINATDGDAEQLLSILRQSGMGIFGGEEKPMSGYGAPTMTDGPEGHGTEPEMSPTVVGDGDDMMALIKKMTGIDMGGSEGNSEDYADEEGEEEEQAEPQTLEPVDSDEGDEESEEEKTDEGNKFTGNLAKARAAGKKEADLDGDGDMEPVKEDDMEEGNLFTGNLAKARAAGKKEADLDGDGDMEKVREGEDTCNECGMYESECGCDHEQVEENWANDAGGDAMADQQLAELKALLSMGNDLHKMKHSQAVGNPVRVAESEITDWKKLSGIK